MTRDTAHRVPQPVRYHGEADGRVHSCTAGVWLPLPRIARDRYGLARALLWDALGAEPHPTLARRFHRDIVQPWMANESWDTDRDRIRAWVLEIAAAPPDDIVWVFASGAPVLKGTSRCLSLGEKKKTP